MARRVWVLPPAGPTDPPGESAGARSREPRATSPVTERRRMFRLRPKARKPSAAGPSQEAGVGPTS